MIAICVIPVGNFVLNPLERAYAPDPPITQPAGILVLGGAEDTAPAYAGSVEHRLPYAAGNGEFLCSGVVEPGAVTH